MRNVIHLEIIADSREALEGVSRQVRIRVRQFGEQEVGGVWMQFGKLHAEQVFMARLHLRSDLPAVYAARVSPRFRKAFPIVFDTAHGVGVWVFEAQDLRQRPTAVEGDYHIPRACG